MRLLLAILLITITLSVSAQTTDSTKVRMNSVRLKAISIKAPRPVYSMDGEIVSYNVANDRTINGLTAMDAIKNSPTVEVDEEGNITMRGSEKVQVWLNGYPTGMNGASLKASGYKCIGKCGGLRWTGRSKPEVDLYPAQMKLRFEKEREENAN